MKHSDIARMRLHSQQIAATQHQSIQGLVGFMGAMQAQDYAMSKWAVGMRLPNTSDEAVEKALSQGKIIRTHLLRPTWHLVSAQDIYWMLALSAPQIKRILNGSDKKLGLNEDIYNKAKKVIENTLTKKTACTRDELIVEFEKAKINTEENRPAHIMMRAEIDGLICNGAVVEKKQTYSLLEERVKKPKSISREEALVKLAERYFTSHGPATLQDFVWWSGLSVSDAKKGLEGIKAHFSSTVVDSDTYWFHEAYMPLSKPNTSLHLLPAYDEYIISYKNRNATLTIADQKKAFSSNGIFRPVVVLNGEGIGLWKRSVKKDEVHVEIELFKHQTKTTQRLVTEKTEQLGLFLNKKVNLK